LYKQSGAVSARDPECRVTVLTESEAQASTEALQANATELDEPALAELASFLASAFGNELCAWQDRLAHWWALNPAWDPSIPRGWFIRSRGGAIVAFTANIPFRYMIDSRPALSCATGSTAVAPHFRGLGLAKAVGRKFLTQTNGELLVGIDSTTTAFGLWRSLGMRSLEEQWQHNNLRVVADARALGRSFAQASPPPRIATRVAANCLAVLFDSLARVSGRSKSLSVEVIDGFSKFDADCVNDCKASHATAYACRDVDTLNWLYFATPGVKRSRVVFVARSAGRLVGYLAMKEWGGHSYYLLECRCRDADPDIARALIWAARDFARQKRARSVLVRPYTSMIETAIPALVSIPLSKPSMSYCYALRTGEMDIENWEAGPGDGDVSVN
jgi:GNAT superfamily N-acetyltransferase